MLPLPCHNATALSGVGCLSVFCLFIVIAVAALLLAVSFYFLARLLWRVAKNKMCPQTHWRYFSSPKIYFVISWIALSFFCLACFSKSFASIHNLTISFCLGRSGTGIVIFKNS